MHPYPTNAIIRWTISWPANTYHLSKLYCMICQLCNSPTNYPTNNCISWIWMPKKIGLMLKKLQFKWKFLNFIVNNTILNFIPTHCKYPNSTLMKRAVMVVCHVINYLINFQLQGQLTSDNHPGLPGVMECTQSFHYIFCR